MTSIRTFSDILSPLHESEFFERYFGNEPCVIKGIPGRFSQFFSWSELNCLLAERWLDYPRIRIIRRGETLPPARYIEYRPGRRGQHVPRVIPERLENEMRKGAMLHLASLEELHSPVAKLAHAVQEALRVDVFVNAHVGLQASEGFDTHWDGHDVFVLQVSGRKEWRFYGVTEKYPLAVSPTEKRGAPKEHTWEGVLEEGDMLYMPRGVWHAARALAEPTMHLTVGALSPTGLDYLAWIRCELEKSEHFRQDIPRFAGDAAVADHAKRLKEGILSMIDEATLRRFLTEMKMSAEIRRQPRLP